MAHKLLDRTKESTTGGGTGNFDLNGAEAGFFAFSAGLSNADLTDYYAEAAGGEHEFGVGTYVSSGNELARTIVRGGSNGTSPVNFSSAPKVAATVNAASFKGSWVELSRATPSGAATCDIVLPPGYEDYRIKLYDFTLSGGVQYLQGRSSTDGGSTFDTGDYPQRPFYGHGSTFSGTNSTYGFIYLTWLQVAASPLLKISGEIELWKPATADRRLITSRIWYDADDSGNATPAFTYNHAYRDAAADIDAFRLFASSGNLSGLAVLSGRRA